MCRSAALSSADIRQIGRWHYPVRLGKLDGAEGYLLRRADQLNGERYPDLLRLADLMEENRRYMAVSVLYRALLESILRRAISKCYTHGVRYLKKLDALAPEVTEWRQFVPHEPYFAASRQANARESVFWRRYEKHRSR